MTTTPATSAATVRRRRAVVAALWLAFIAAHAAASLLGWLEPNGARGDMSNVYEPWSNMALRGEGIVGVTQPWVYPPLALAPMIVAQGFAPFVGYAIAWPLLIFVLDAVAFWLLLGAGASRSRRAAAVFWIAFIVALGPIAIFRIDAVTVPLAVIAVLFVRQRPLVATALLAAGAWIKIWPGAVIAAAFAGARRKRAWVEGTLVVSFVVSGVVVLSGGLGILLGFLSTQTDRGLQAESVFATPFVLRAAASVPGALIYFDPGIITFQVSDPASALVARILTPLLVLAAATLVAIGIIAHRRGAAMIALVPPLALALVLCLIVFNKVGSPQFQTWLVAPIVLWLLWDRRSAVPYAAVALAAAVLTHVLYPLVYDAFVRAEWLPAIVVTLRNAALVALFVASTARVVRVAWRGSDFHSHPTHFGGQHARRILSSTRRPRQR